MRAKITIIIVLILIILVILGLFNLINKNNHEKSNYEPVELKVNEPVQLTNDLANQDYIGIFEDRVVWQDDRHGNWDIYMYNLENGKETRITKHPSYQVEPAIYGDIIVWKDLRNNEGLIKDYPIDYNSDIYIYNITTGKKTQVTTNDQCQYAPKIFGNYITWLDYRSGKSEVWLYNLITGKERIISDNRENCTSCKIYKNIVIWRVKINNSDHLFKYDINSDKATKLDIGPNFDINDFNFNDDYLAFSAVLSPGNDSDIFLYNFNSKEITQITTNDTCQYGPIITENAVLWTDLRNDPDGIQWCSCKPPTDPALFDNWDIYYYNLTNGSEIQLTKSQDSETLCDCFQDKVVLIKTIKNIKNVYIIKFR